jgi:2'-5' RNA ligase
VRLGRLEALGARRRPSAFSVVLTDGHDEVAAFMASLQGPALEAAGCPPEKRAPLPHVTVARPRRQARDAERRRAAEWALARPPVDVEVVLDRLHLYTGAPPNAERRSYREVATWPDQK